MRRLGLVVPLLLLAVGCSTDPRLATPSEVRTAPEVMGIHAAAATDGQQADSLAIEALILQLYNNLNNGNGPLNAAQVRWRQIAQLYVNCTLVPPQSPCDQAGAQANTYVLAQDILDRYHAGGLNNLAGYSSASGTGTGAAVTDLLNLLLRYVGLEDNVCSFGSGVDCNATVYQPGSPATDLVAPSGQAGVRLPPGTGTVTRPTIVSVSRVVDPSVRLHTELDQYLFRYELTSSSGQGADPDDPFLQDVTVEVCLASDNSYPAGALARLALAHDVAEPAPYENIQVLPGGISFLSQCGTVPASTTLGARLTRGLTDGLAALVLPRPLYAVAVGTGTVGTTKNLSPFGAVDTVGFIAASATPPATAPEGGTVAAPAVRLATAAEQGNPAGPGMAGIPVTFTITAGTGCFAGAGCPTAYTTSTDAQGYATAPSWTVGTGSNTVTATAAIPCAAPVPAGSTPNCGRLLNANGGSAVSFQVTGRPPTQVNFNATSLQLFTAFAGATYAPGTPFTVTVLVQTADGQTVPGFTGPVTLAISPATGGLVCPAGCTVNAVGGVATFTGVYITSAGTFQLYATSPGLTSAPNAPTGGFAVVPPASSASAIAAVNWATPTAPSGTIYSGLQGPTARVTDPYGNVVPGVSVFFTVASGTGSVGTTPVTTNSNGLATTSWTIGDGTNVLTAYFDVSDGLPEATFTATGTSAFATLVDCAPTNGTGDEFNRGFYFTRNGMKKLKTVTVYLASNDPANVPTNYAVRLTVRAGAFNGAVVGQQTVTARLNGQASQNLGTNFDFGGVSLPGGTKTLAFQLELMTNPDRAKVFFAQSTCTTVTETVDFTAPLSSALRKGVGLKVTGN